jgi:hypothetical protein
MISGVSTEQGPATTTTFGPPNDHRPVARARGREGDLVLLF